MSDDQVKEIAIHEGDMRLLYCVLDNFYRICRGYKDNLKRVDFEKAREIREKLSLHFEPRSILKDPEKFPGDDEPRKVVSAALIQDLIDDMAIIHDDLDDKNWSMAEGDQLIKRHMVKPNIERVGTLASEDDHVKTPKDPSFRHTILGGSRGRGA
jgi:hypothetical protein